MIDISTDSEYIECIMTSGKRWTREELLIAYNLYCKIPFGKLSSTNPEIMKVASALGRTPASLSMKLCNFASLDPELQKRGIKGLSGVSKADREFFEEFKNNWNDYVLESETLVSKLSVDSSEELSDFPKLKQMEETEKISQVKTRMGQAFFRKMTLANYEYKCAITGNPIPQLLRASHILPWNEFPEERLNPHNGICLSALHDAAFDRGLISFDENYRLILSPRIKEELFTETINLNFLQYEGKPLSLPERFLPDAKFLAWHRKQFLQSYKY